MDPESSVSHAHGAEEWRPVLGLEGLYEVSDLGRVRSFYDRRGGVLHARAEPLVLRQTVARRDYRTVGVGGRTRSVHALVLEAFVGPRPTGMQGAHLNGRPSDNRRANLMWATPAENTRHKWLHGSIKTGDESWSRLHPERLARGDRHGSRLHPDRLARGERSGAYTHPERVVRGDGHYARTRPERLPRGSGHGQAKLTEALVRDIHAEAARGARGTDLAAVYGVSPSTISSIVLGRTWRHATGLHPHPGAAPRGEGNPAAKLTTSQVIEIREAAARGESQSALAKRFAVGTSTIGRVVRREKWTHVS